MFVRSIRVTEDDKVIVTLGSMTEGSSLGSMDSPAALLGKTDGGSWALWERIAAGQTQFGHPSNFADHVEQSKWMSFTTTLHDPTFFELIRDLDGQRTRRRRAHYFSGVQLAGFNRVAPSAAFHWAARGSAGVLGVWAVC